MKKKTPYLDFYKKYMECGQLPTSGLCCSVIGSNTWNDLSVFREGAPIHRLYGKDWHWGYDGEVYDDWNYMCPSRRAVIEYTFSPLRQNMVLLLAAMNGEL